MFKKKDISRRRLVSWNCVFLFTCFLFVFSIGSVSSQAITITDSRLALGSEGNVPPYGILFDYKNTTSYTDGTKLTENVYLMICGYRGELKNKYVATFYKVDELFIESSIIPLKIHEDDFLDSSLTCIRKDLDFNPMVAVYPGLKYFAFYDSPDFPKSGEGSLNFYEISQEYGFFNGSFEFELKNFTEGGDNIAEMNITDVLDHEGNSIDTTYISGFDVEILIGLRLNENFHALNKTKKGEPVNLTFPGHYSVDDFEIVINGLVDGVPADPEIVDPPEPPPTPAPSRGPRAPSVVEVPEPKPQYSFTLERISTTVVQGQFLTFSSTVRNIGEEAVVDYSFSTDCDFVVLPQDFSLSPGEESVIEFLIYSPYELGNYSCQIVVDGSGIKNEIPLGLRVVPGVLFDVVVNVLPEYRHVYAGEDVRARVLLKNLGFEDVELEVKSYISKGQEEIVSKNRTIRVRDEYEFVEEFVLPLELDDGEYNFNVMISYDNITLVGYDNFYVHREPSYTLVWAISAVLLVLLIAFLIGIGRDLILLNRLDSLASKALIMLRKGELDQVGSVYERIRTIYNYKLGYRFRSRFYDKGIRLHSALKNKGVRVDKFANFEE